MQIGESAGPECKAVLQEVTRLVDQRLEFNEMGVKSVFGASQVNISVSLPDTENWDLYVFVLHAIWIHLFQSTFEIKWDQFFIFFNFVLKIFLGVSSYLLYISVSWSYKVISWTLLTFFFKIHSLSPIILGVCFFFVEIMIMYWIFILILPFAAKK